MTNELTISGVNVSRDVIASVVTAVAGGVEGVAKVGTGNDIASSLVSVLTAKPALAGPAVEVEMDGDALRACVHLAVFYGYPFTKLAQAVREAVAEGVREQVGVTVGAVDVCIDSLVFPKE